MAQSRLERIGTIFTRVQSLMKTGAMKQENKPLWYVIYQAFPPKYEPRFDRATPNIEVKDIFYKEDIIRAKFQKEYGNNLRFNIINNETQSPTQRFISIYQGLEKTGVTGNELWEKALESFNQENTDFKAQRTQNQKKEPSAQKPKPEIEKLNIDILKIFE